MQLTHAMRAPTSARVRLGVDSLVRNDPYGPLSLVTTLFLYARYFHTSYKDFFDVNACILTSCDRKGKTCSILGDDFKFFHWVGKSKTAATVPFTRLKYLLNSPWTMCTFSSCVLVLQSEYGNSHSLHTPLKPCSALEKGLEIHEFFNEIWVTQMMEKFSFWRGVNPFRRHTAFRRHVIWTIWRKCRGVRCARFFGLWAYSCPGSLI